MMIMLRIPENKHKLSSTQRLLHGHTALMLCSDTVPTDTQPWSQEEPPGHEPPPQTFSKDRNKISGSRKGRIPAEMPHHGFPVGFFLKYRHVRRVLTTVHSPNYPSQKAAGGNSLIPWNPA